MKFIVKWLANVLVFALVAGLAGLGSAWHMVEKGSSLVTASSGPWVAWTHAGRTDTDPYTRAHVVRRGLLPLTSSLALTYEAELDSEGKRIHSACEYAIDVTGLDASWWSLAVFDDSGSLIRNTAERHAYNSATIVRDLEGRAIVALARDARPGNWLPTGGAGRLALMLTLQDAKWVAATLNPQGKPKPMPEIQRVACR